MKSLLLSFVVLSCCAAPAQQAAKWRRHGAYLLPDPKATPSVVDPKIVADTSRDRRVEMRIVDGRRQAVELNICAPDFRTPPFRSATKSEKEKKAVCAAYGADGCPGKAWELDDICPVELGCANVPANLWPQPIAQARVKDHQVEDKLGGPRGLVCAGKISLEDARRCVVDDWVVCAEKVKALEAGK